MSEARPFKHRTPNCHGAPSRYPGHLGDTLEGCGICKAFRVIPPSDETPEQPPRHHRTGYVCRTHGTPVRWTGTGCQPCAQEIDNARAARRLSRAKRRQLAADQAEASALGISVNEYRNNDPRSAA
jgi:hypothetical protein